MSWNEVPGAIFYNLLIQSIPNNKFLKSVKGQIASAPQKELTGKKHEPKVHPVRTDRSEYDIIVCFGDSLTSGYGASSGMDYPSHLARMIHESVINVGIPGDTTAWALRRPERDVLSKNPDIVLITLGGNDFKNGLSKDITFRN